MTIYIDIYVTSSMRDAKKISFDSDGLWKDAAAMFVASKGAKTCVGRIVFYRPRCRRSDLALVCHEAYHAASHTERFYLRREMNRLQHFGIKGGGSDDDRAMDEMAAEACEKIANASFKLLGMRSK